MNAQRLAGGYYVLDCWRQEYHGPYKTRQQADTVREIVRAIPDIFLEFCTNVAVQLSQFSAIPAQYTVGSMMRVYTANRRMFGDAIPILT